MYLSYEFFSYDRHDRYNDMETRLYLTEWFQQQTEFTTEFEAMEVNEMNKCLSKFYVSVRRKDGIFYKRNSLLSVRAKLFTEA